MKLTNIWPIRKIIEAKYKREWNAKVAEEKTQLELKPVFERIEKQEARDVYFLHVKELSNHYYNLMDIISVEKELNGAYQNIDVLMKDLKNELSEDKTTKVSPEIIQKNKAILRYYKEDLKERYHKINSEEFDFSEPCPCGSGKIFYGCHLK